MSDPVTRLNATRVAFVGLVLLIVLVVLIRAPSDAPRPMNAAEGEPTEAPTGVEGVVTFGYGVVLDFSNAGGDLRLCE